MATSSPTCGESNLPAIRSTEGNKEDNNEHQAKIKVEEYAQDRYPVALDVATDVGKAAKESRKVTIITLILKNMS